MGTFVKVDDLRFVDEPPPRRVVQPSATQKIMSALAEHKDRWAMIAVNQKGTIGQTLRRAYPDYEIICRNEKTGAAMTDPTWTVWACYRGARYQIEQAEKRRERGLKKRAKLAESPVSEGDATING